MVSSTVLTKALIGATLLSGLTTVPAMAAKVKLTWYATGNASWKVLADKYMKQHPNVLITNITGDMDKFYTMTTAGLMPDIWGPWGTPGIHADVNRNWAVELTPYIKRDGKSMNISDFFPGLMREFRVAGKQYSLPVFNYVDYYFYNTDLYAQNGIQPPPLDSNDKDWNWDRMVADVRKISKTNANGRLTTVGVDFMRDSNTPSYWSLFGASPYSAKALASSVPQEIHYDTPEMLQAFTSVWDLIHKYKVAGTANMGFTTGKVAADIGPGWNVMYYMDQKKLHWRITNLPWAKTNKGTMWPDGWRISRVCRNKEVAWDFLKFICSPESMRFIATNTKDSYTGTPVARKSVFKETLGKNIGAATGMSQEDVFRVTEQSDAVGICKYSESICVDRDMAKYVEPILNNLWVNRVSPAAASAQLQQVADKRLPELFKRWVRNIKFTGAE